MWRAWEASAAAGRCDCDERARFEAATPSSGLIKLREIAWPAGRAPVSEGALISYLSELEVVGPLGVPREKGKDGTVDGDLYTHRSGRIISAPRGPPRKPDAAPRAIRPYRSRFELSEGD